MEGHLFAALIDHREVSWPLVVLLVSGGHTLLALMEGPGRYRILGSTIDDAAGEAFDKVARFIGLGYPGGPAIEAAAASGAKDAFSFPRPLLRDGTFDFSFSGLKTAVIRAVRAAPASAVADVAASFQEAVVDVLVQKAMRAVRVKGAAGVCLAGGVAANSRLRQRLRGECEEASVGCHLASRAMCTDNAAMIAAAGAWQLAALGPSPLDLAVDPSLPFPAGR